MRGLLEQIHDGLTDDRPEFIAQQRQPGRVGIDQNAFLDLGDCVIGMLQNRSQLAAGIARGA